MKSNWNDKMIICTNCAGCSVCAFICLQNAISILIDDEGFYHYYIDESRCIKCGLCQKVCPENSEKSNYYGKKLVYDQKYYAGRNYDESIVKQSSSGGIFSAFCETIISRGGSVYGVVIDYSSFEIVYKRATRMEETLPMRGSKYVQAFLSQEIIELLINDINSGIPILFSGTSCYVKGIKNFLKMKNYDTTGVFFVDFICAGVISTKLWKREIEHYSKKLGKISGVNFRSKKHGWRDFSMLFETVDKTDSRRFVLSNIGLLQSKDEALGRACNHCKYCSYDRPGDITVGDFWNEHFLPHKWWDDKGVSSIMINNIQGEALLEISADHIDLKPVEKHMVYNSRFEANDHEIDYRKRKELYDDAENREYEKYKNKWIKVPFSDRILLGILRPIYLRLGIHRYKK